jgi:hypothetical protein
VGEIRPTRFAMPPKSRFTRLDAFTKTVDEARIRTTSGGIVTIVSLIVVFFLAWGEWADYRKVVIHPELVVDKGRGSHAPPVDELG